MGTNVLLDGNYFYFLTKSQQDNTSLNCLSIDMISSQIKYAESVNVNAFDDDKPAAATQLSYPQWS